MGKQKGTKMSFTEFMGGQPTRDIDFLPSGPKERGPDDDGSFRRNNRRSNDDYNDREPSRSDGDSSWRRGNMSRASSDRSGFGDRAGGYGDRGGYDRGDRGGYDRGDRGGYDRGDRGGFGDRGDRGGFGDRGGGPRYGDSFRGGQDSFRSSGGGPAPPTERPRLNLSRRSLPVEKPATATDDADKISKPKVNPFGSAKAVDTTSKMADLGLNPKPANTVSEEPADTVAEKEEPDNEPPSEDPNQKPKFSDRRNMGQKLNPRAAALESLTSSKSSSTSSRNMGPPPVTNTRFQNLGSDDRDSSRRPTRNEGMSSFGGSRRFASEDSHDNGGPPKSRFALAAEMDQRRRDDDGGGGGGPPPNSHLSSRFGEAADMGRRDRDRDRDHDRHGWGGGGDRGGDFRSQSERFSRDNSSRGFGRDYGRDRDDRYRSNDRDHRYDRTGPRPSENDFPTLQQSAIAKPIAVPPPTAPPILTLPGEDEAAALARIERKKKEAKEKEEAEKRAAEEARLAQEEAERRAKEETEKAAAVEGDLLQQFASGEKLGEDLSAWCQAQELLPSVEKLVFTLLKTREKKNPDVECAWAEPDNFGTALLSLVEDDVVRQMEVLWAIQKYCDDMGFPKINDEYLVQAMFRSMYKYDLADEESFSEWKENEDEQHEKGKMNAIIQTVEWFNWLEEDDEESDEDEEEEEAEE